MYLPVSISTSALSEIKKMLSTKRIGPELGLRIGIKGSGCSGTSFLLGFDKPGIHDAQFEIEGIKVLIEKKHFIYLTGMKIDFVEDNMQRGFTFVAD